MAYELIETVEVGAGGAASIEFSSIPQDGVDLVCVISARCDIDILEGRVRVNFNFDTGENYYGTQISATGSSQSGGKEISNYIQALGASGSLTSANTFGSQSIYISNYTASQNKSVSVDAVVENGLSGDGAQNISNWSWANTSAISSIQITLPSDNFVAGSTTSLYKIY